MSQRSVSGRAHVVILNYRSGDALRTCLESLQRSDAAGLPVLVVDNDSDDGSAEGLESMAPGVRVHRLPENLGFAGGVNAALELLAEAPPEQVLLLNPDTRVAADFLAPLQESLDAGAAVAGPKLLTSAEPPRIWSAGGRATFGRNLSVLVGHGERDRGQHDQARDVTFLPATVWLVRWQTLRRCGPLDEHFFCYLEDLDYCLRLTEQGQRLRYEPRSVVVHEGSQASGGGYTPLRKYLNAHGSWRVLRKHGTPGRWLRFLLADVATTPLAVLGGWFRGRGRAASWKLRGLLDGLRGREFTADRHRQLMQEGRR